jgi:PAS domain S-box-containing protein
MHKFKISIRVKMALLVCAASALLFAVAIGSVYTTAVRSMGQAAGLDYAKMARLLAGAVAMQFDSSLGIEEAPALPPAKAETAAAAPAAPAVKGQTAVSDISYNDSRKEWLVTLSVPKGGKVVLPISAFFAPLENFKLGRTGEAVLVDDKSYVIYQRDSRPFVNKFCSYDELQAVLQAPANWREMSGVYKHDTKVLAAFAPVETDALANKGIKWWVFVLQDAKEAAAPADKLILTLSALAVILTLLFGLLALLLGWFFTSPIQRLRDGIANITRGDLDKKIEVGSGDEIEAVADSFNEMIEGLKKTTTSVANLSKERAEHQKADDKIRQMTDEWNNTFDSLTDMAFIADKSLTITKANKAFLETVRMGAESVIGKKCYEVLHKTSKPWPACPFDPNKLGKGPMTEELYEPHLGKHLRVTVAPIFDKATGFSGTIHIARDITEIRQAQDELTKKAEEARSLKQFKNDLISVVSQLRSSVTAAGVEIKAALDSVSGQFNEKQKKVAAQATDDIGALTRSMDSIVDIAKLETGKMELKTQLVDLRELVRKVIFVYEPKIRDKGLDLKTDIPRERISINVDPARIEQVFGILIDNAIKFTEKGRIDIALKDLKDEAECVITDTGIGIATEDLPHVFERISAAGQGISGKDKGMGIGLSIAKGIIAMHRGKIWIESIPGKGTKFVFRLHKNPKNT